jgi:hypothetical protein
MSNGPKGPVLCQRIWAGEGEGIFQPIVPAKDIATPAVSEFLGAILGEKQGGMGDALVAGQFMAEEEGDGLSNQIGNVGLEQFVLGTGKSLGTAWITLACAASEELAIDPLGFVTFGGDDMKAADLGNALAKLNVRAASGHIGGDGNAAGQAGIGNDPGFFLVMNGIEEAEWKMPLAQEGCEALTGVDVSSSDENGATGGMDPFDFLGDTVPFGDFIREKQVGPMPSNAWFVGGEPEDWKAIDLPEFRSGFVGCAGHA